MNGAVVVAAYSQKVKTKANSYLLILRCLVAIAEQLEVQVFVLLEEILKLILLGKKGGEKTVFRTQEVTMIRPEHSTPTQHVVSDSPCIIHLRRLLEVF